MNLIDTALRIAKSNPDVAIPCPLCASSVNGDNLASHVAKVHPNASTPPAAEPTAKIGTVPAWRGSDARASIPLLLAMIPLAVIAVAVKVPAVMIAAAVASTGLMVLIFLAMFRKIPARLALAQNAIVMRGLVARRSVDLPCKIETGTIIEPRTEAGQPADYNAPGIQVDAGTYLRFKDDSGKISNKIVVACRAKASHLGAARGKKRKKWDMELPREAFVALQYELLDRGLLAVDRPAA